MAVNVTKLINDNIKAIGAAERKGMVASGSLVIDGLRSLCKAVAPVNGKPSKISVECGAQWALGYDNMKRAQKDKKPIKMKDLSNYNRSGVIAVVRIGAEKAWYGSFWNNVLKVHATQPMSYTLLIGIGRAVMDKKKGYKNCPSVDNIKAMRAKIIAGKKREEGGLNPRKRLKTISDALKGLRSKLPSDARPHYDRIVTELRTIVGVMKE